MKQLTTKVLVSGFYFLEGPRWRDGWLWVSDMVGRKVYRISPDGDVEFVVDVPGRPSGLGFLSDGSPLVVSMRDRKLFKIEQRQLVLYADLSSLVQDDLNDMVVDEQGQAYVGSYGFQNRDLKSRCGGSLVLVKPPGFARVVASDLKFPNGCIITRDRRRLVLAETFAQRLTAFEIMPDGGLSEPTRFADLGNVSPDGICDDGEGGIWVAAAGRPEFVRVLEGGTVTHRVNTPGRQAVACQLGGANGHTLFCLTADGAFEDIEGCEATARLEVVQLREGP